MARFTVRIELQNGHNASGNGHGYEALNRAMEAQGFTRLIEVADGTSYHLPTAEYRMVGQHTRAQVCRRARAAAAGAKTDAAILVTEGSCSWHNLRSSDE